MSDSDSLDSYERPPPPAIHAAVRNLDVDAARRALAAGANVDVLDEEGYTPLYVACQNDHEACAQMLLGRGANVDLAMQGGPTPLWMVCQEGTRRARGYCWSVTPQWTWRCRMAPRR